MEKPFKILMVDIMSPKNSFHLLLKGTVQVTDSLSRCIPGIPRLVNDFYRGLGGAEGLKTVFALFRHQWPESHFPVSNLFVIQPQSIPVLL